MTTLISLILIPLDLIAADWTIKWAEMSRRRRRRHNDWECLGNENRGWHRIKRARLRGIGTGARSKLVAPLLEEGAKNGHYFSLHSPPSTIKSSPDNCFGLNRD